MIAKKPTNFYLSHTVNTQIKSLKAWSVEQQKGLYIFYRVISFIEKDITKMKYKKILKPASTYRPQQRRLGMVAFIYEVVQAIRAVI